MVYPVTAQKNVVSVIKQIAAAGGILFYNINACCNIFIKAIDAAVLALYNYVLLIHKDYW